MSEQNQNFRAGVKDWIKDNFPSTLKGQNPATVGYAAALKTIMTSGVRDSQKKVGARQPGPKNMAERV